MSTASSNLRLKGWLLAAAGMLFVSTDSLFVRLGEGSGATMAFLMACGSTLSLSAVAITRPRGVEVARQSMAAAPLAVLLIAMLGAATQFCFIVAVTQTSLRTSWSSLAHHRSQLRYGVSLVERPERRVLWAIIITAIGIGATMSGTLGSPSFGGDLVAVVAICALGYRSSCSGSTPGSIDHPRWRPVLQ